MVETARKAQVGERVCFVCQGTGFLRIERGRLGSVHDLNTAQTTGQRSIPNSGEAPREALYRLGTEKARLENQKRSLLKTIECIQRQQNIIEQKREKLVKLSTDDL